MKYVIIFSVSIVQIFAHIRSEDIYLAQDFLRDIVSRISKDADPRLNDYIEYRQRSLVKDMEEEPDVVIRFGKTNLHQSLRDQEFLQHSSLSGNKHVSGGAGEGMQLLKPEGVFKNRQEVKTDATLPAYCNPPNPCPLGYTAENGCIENFENTAVFSRQYQAEQDCMCDTEHMFECPNPSERGANNRIGALSDMGFRYMKPIKRPRFHKDLVSKKYHLKKSVKMNPFLTGERLPVAAKKGNDVVY